MGIKSFITIGLVASLGTFSCANRVLQHGTPESVGLLSGPLEQLPGNLSRYTLPANYSKFSYEEIHPIQPGGTVMVGHKATIVSAFAFGSTSKYADGNGTLLPEEDWIPARMDTMYDLASLTKIFTAVAALRLMDEGKLDYTKTVASYLPEFATNGKDNITILMLLTHTSGFPADPSPGLWISYDTLEERVNAIIQYELADTPGSTYTYSDLNFMNLRYVLEKITGSAFTELVYSFTKELGMTSTVFNRGNLVDNAFSYYQRVAPTEFEIDVEGSTEPDRPQPVRGSVHDENAWSLNGVSGHAGLFSSVGDIAILCQMILNNGTYNGKRILSQKSVDLMFTNFNQKFSGDEHSLGFELNQYYFSGPMASLQTAGHTGFTGTSMVIDRASDTFFIHLANRVHPSRDWSSNNIVRQALGYWVALSLGRDVTFPEL